MRSVNAASHQIDATLRRLATEQASRDYDLGVAMLAAERDRTHQQWGFRSVLEYLEHRLPHLRPGSIMERLRVARRLEELPLLAAALREGRVAFSIVREITRIAIAEHQADWLAWAAGKTARQAERKVAELPPGSGPDAAPDPSLARHRIVLDFDRESFAIVTARLREMRKVYREATDEELFTMLAVGEQEASDRPAFRMDVQIDEAGRTTLGDEAIEVPDEVGERALCDSAIRWVGSHVGATGRGRRAVPAKVHRLVVQRAKGCCELCGGRYWLQEHHIVLVSEGGTNDPDNLCYLCWLHHRRIHDGVLRIEGTRATGLVFRHADGTIYGYGGDPAAVQVGIAAREALRQLGFGEGEANAALSRVREEHGSLDLETTIRLARGMRGKEPAKSPIAEDAISALKSLRFADEEARPAVREILEASPDLALDEVIVRALKRLGSQTKSYTLHSEARESGPEYGSFADEMWPVGDWIAPTWEVPEEVTTAGM